MEVDRLRQFRKSLHLNQSDFCKPLGLLQGSYSDIERGKSSITFRMVKDMIRVYDLNPNWLFLGEGNRVLSDTSDATPPVASSATPDVTSSHSRENALLQQQIKSLEGENEALKKLVKMYEKLQG